MKSDGVELCIGWYRTVGCIVAIWSSGILAKQPSKSLRTRERTGEAEGGGEAKAKGRTERASGLLQFQQIVNIAESRHARGIGPRQRHKLASPSS